MRAAAMSVWVFINLLCFGMCGYLYLIWSQYWLYIEKQRLFNQSPETPRVMGLSIQESNNYYPKHSYNTDVSPSTLRIDSIRKRSVIGSFWSKSKLMQTSTSDKIIISAQIYPSSTVVRNRQGSPRFPNIHKPILEFDNEKYVCSDLTTPDCETRTTEFREVLLKEFHRVLMGASRVFKSGLESQNPYAVKYEGGRRSDTSAAEVLCALRNVKVQTVTAEDEPFRRLGFHIGRQPLQQERVYNTCAVVTSAGALFGSRFGEFIDTHDMVLRFNNAPTEDFVKDVGSKTTFRVLNSQIIAKPEFNFLEDSLYKGISIIIWDPANYSSTLEDWYHHPDFPLFPVYKELLKQRPDADVHLLHPKVLWELWTLLQDFSPYRLRRNPPSSGFIGIWFALQRCRRVRVFEYVPSARASRRCHYYASHEDQGCTLGSWHPLAQEKALVERMRDNSDIDAFQKGFVNIPGVMNASCH